MLFFEKSHEACHFDEERGEIFDVNALASLHNPDAGRIRFLLRRNDMVF